MDRLLKPASPETTGMSGERLERAANLLNDHVGGGEALAGAICVARGGTVVLNRAFGRLRPTENSPPVTPDTPFLIASVTKPFVSLALMQLVERGQVALSDPVKRYLPEFSGDYRDNVQVRHLLSHASGLPDMTADNIALRQRNAPMSEFIRAMLKDKLLFKPGTDVRYQSCGFALQGEIVERLTRMPLREFMRREIFGPLGMKHTALGLGHLKLEQTPEVGLEEWIAKADTAEGVVRWGHNSPYWRDLGTPWGGMHSSVNDTARFYQVLLNGGTYGGQHIIGRTTVEAMTCNQNPPPLKPWGLGFGIGATNMWGFFGDLVGPRTFGHGGATGCVVWADPDRELLCVIYTTRPMSRDGGRFLRLVSNAVVAAA